MMKSIYTRQFLLMSLIILLSFSLLGGTFVGLSYRYTISERQDVLQRNAETVATMTGGLVGQGIGLRSDYYQLFVTSAAQAADAYVILAENDGRIIYCAGNEEKFLDLAGETLPSSVVNTVSQGNPYRSMSTLGGLFPELHYVAIEPITVNLAQFTPGASVEISPARAGMVVVAASAASLSEMWRAFATLFLFAAVIVFFIAFLISSVTSMRFTRPLKQMVEATKKFGHGEFDARVETGDREDEIYELAVAFNQMAESLAKADADRSEFIANVSHELKTPMTTIAGFVDGILDGTIPPDKQEDALRTVSAETRRLSRLVRRMLDVSRIKATQSVVAQERFDICEVLLRVLVSLEGKINQHELDVATLLPEDPVHVWGDPDSITQVCYNLLDNAIKFAAPGTTLTLAIASKGTKVHVSIRNVGETIPAEELGRVFDRFHKTDHSRSIDRDGVGLGLYIVKTILDNHKENITVTSEEGVTEFTFTLTQA